MTLEEALEKQREGFKETHGCYPEELVHSCCGQQLEDCACVYDLFERCKCNEQKD